MSVVFSRPDRLAALALSLLWAVAFASGAEEPSIRLAGGEAPAVLQKLGQLDNVSALTIGPDGRRAAVVTFDPENEQRSSLSLHSVDTDEPLTIDFAGAARDALFTPDGAAVFLLVHRVAKKKRPGETYLHRVDLDPLRNRRLLRVSYSARDMDLWASEGMLLIVARDELRSFRLPELRSGPLFRIIGENLSVAWLGDSRVLIGQADGVALADLGDRSEREGLPLRGRLFANSPVVALAAGPDGTSVLVQMLDGTVETLHFDPLRFAGGDGTANSATVVEARPLTPAPTPEVDSAAARPPATPTAAEPPAAPEVEITPEVEIAPPVEVVSETRQPPPRREEPAKDDSADADAPAVRGRIEGAAVSDVQWVVLLGPNNLLREATRVRPGADGSWRVDELEPGRYRVQLDGGGQRVPVSRPPFLILDVADAPVEAPPMQVLRSL
ncbi:MAG: hypothetical protein GY716_11140 [bacterium]|nr:hypothetical protein [bacterium]